ncbi:MAG TPA: winged helix-turn-helix domain-containing protein [Allosphingosinicella sp.]|jgi:DNA-binding winged helix-turn-helix (wHTH) protein/tetratricopeptide (TPR) repeat protein|nr:winged helix-turn-helix domain-containing protein [Allosphingosinicella sp.]
MATDGHEDPDQFRRQRVSLAGEPSRRLGPLTIEPALRRVAHDDGREEFVEPRVMQVLLALLRADGATLSRDELVFACWDGRIVGDDAINRVLSRLRRIAEGIGEGSFRIETLTRVGYRLMREGQEAPNGQRRRRRFSPLPVSVAAALLLGLAGGSLLAWDRWVRKHDIPSVTLVNQAHGPEAGMLAASVASDLSRLAAARASDLAVVQSPAAADYVIAVSGERRGDRLHAQLTLSGRATGEMLWSIGFDRAASDAADLHQQVAVKLGDVLFCTLHGAPALDSATLRLFLSFCDHRHDLPSIADIDLLRQVVARAPGFARARGMLAAREAELGSLDESMNHDDTPERRTYRAAALADLNAARALDPTLAEIYYAQARIDTDPHHWAERLAVLERGIANDRAAILYQAQVEDLMRVGRMQDAVEAARNAVSLDPLSPWNREALISALAYSGRTEEARGELEGAERLWPGSELMTDVRYRFDLRYGDPASALRLLAGQGSPTIELTPSPPTEKAFLLARIDPSPGKIAAALDAARPHRPGAYPLLSFYLQALVTFGRIDEDFAAMDASQSDPFWREGTWVLFRSHMRPLWRDPRFMGFAAKLGLVHYWAHSGHWPDFCSDPDLRYDCRAEAQRLSRHSQPAPARMG